MIFMSRGEIARMERGKDFKINYVLREERCFAEIESRQEE